MGKKKKTASELVDFTFQDKDLQSDKTKLSLKHDYQNLHQLINDLGDTNAAISVRSVRTGCNTLDLYDECVRTMILSDIRDILRKYEDEFKDQLDKK